MLDGAEHTDGDAWVLTAMLLVPRAVVHTRSLSAIAEVAWQSRESESRIRQTLDGV
jgi:hypothetical protein